MAENKTEYGYELWRKCTHDTKSGEMRQFLEVPLKELLDQGEKFRLDEILKGTNSVDRHLGAESLILQLNELNAFGLVSTHDLELGKLCEQNDLITNYNFSSKIDGEEIIFDYKLRNGICQSTNASQLMAKIGINIK